MARVILETLRSIPVPDVHHDLRRVLAIISRLGEDSGMKRQNVSLRQTKIIIIIITTMRSPMRLVLDGDKRGAR